MIGDWLDVLSEGVYELRALQLPDGRKAASRCYLLPDEKDKLARAAARLSDDGAKGVYLVYNPLHPDRHRSPKSSADSDVIRRHWLFVDLDPVRPADVCSTDGELHAAEQRRLRIAETLEHAGFADVLHACSGNGYYLLVPVDLPNDEDSKELVKDFLHGLAQRFDDTTVKVDPRMYNASRIGRFFGTLNRKGKPTAERPHRESYVVSMTVPTADLRAANTAALRKLVKRWRWLAAQRQQQEQQESLSAKDRARRYLKEVPPAVSGQGGHNATYHAACVLVRGFALAVPDALEVLTEWNTGCKPPWSHKDLLRKIHEAAKAKDDKPLGYLLGDRDRPEDAGPTVLPPESAAPEEGDPRRRKKETSVEEIASLHDLEREGGKIEWVWKSWIQRRVLTMIAAEPGCGKTRLVCDLVRRVRHGLTWPDGQDMTLPPESRVLWVVSDNHHDEMVSLGHDFDIMDAVYINAHKEAVYDGVFLDSPRDLADLERRISLLTPALVVVDTVGNSTARALHRSEDAVAYYAPLQQIARRQDCAILCLTHLNAEGGVLGRRGTEKVRVVVKLQTPDDEPVNSVLRHLFVEKSNSKKPRGLTVTMGTTGNEYEPTEAASDALPAARRKHTPKLPPAEEVAARAWIVDYLRTVVDDKPALRRVRAVRAQWELAHRGQSTTVFYNALDALGYAFEDRKAHCILEVPDDGEEATAQATETDFDEGGFEIV